MMNRSPIERLGLRKKYPSPLRTCRTAQHSQMSDVWEILEYPLGKTGQAILLHAPILTSAVKVVEGVGHMIPRVFVYVTDIR